MTIAVDWALKKQLSISLSTSNHDVINSVCWVFVCETFVLGAAGIASGSVRLVGSCSFDPWKWVLSPSVYRELATASDNNGTYCSPGSPRLSLHPAGCWLWAFSLPFPRSDRVKALAIKQHTLGTPPPISPSPSLSLPVLVLTYLRCCCFLNCPPEGWMKKKRVYVLTLLAW